jgi:hypothetical protein
MGVFIGSSGGSSPLAAISSAPASAFGAPAEAPVQPSAFALRPTAAASEVFWLPELNSAPGSTARSGATDPPASARNKATESREKSASLKVYWGRLAFAGGFLLVILVAGFVAAILKLGDWNSLLNHSFELLLGIFMGLLGGDFASNRNSG